MKKTISRFTSILLSILTLVCVAFPVSAFAAEPDTVVTPEVQTSNQEIVPYAGVETLPYGWYDIGTFSFTRSNVTPVKTVSGRYLTLSIGYRTSAADTGSGPIRLTVRVKDYYTGQYIDTYVFNSCSGYDYPSFSLWKIDLGSTGRRVHICFEVESANGDSTSRRADIIYFRSYVE